MLVPGESEIAIKYTSYKEDVRKREIRISYQKERSSGKRTVIPPHV